MLVLQIKNSPIIDQQYEDYQPDFTIAAPGMLHMVHSHIYKGKRYRYTNQSIDIRFCFDGWTSPILKCTTDFGQLCNEFIVNITDSIQSNVNFYHYALTCYLFRAPSLKLGPQHDRTMYNGTSIKFYFYDTQSSLNKDSVVHVEFYHMVHNPNVALYYDTDHRATEGFDGWYSSDESAQFQSAEQLNLKTRNLFDIMTQPTSIGYTLMERQVISSVWNYIDFFMTSKTKQSQMSVHTQTVLQNQINNNMDRNIRHGSLGSIDVIPLQYSTKVTREHRAFTLINGMGILGGIVGLIIGCEACLFGYRPRSPWGLVHRCSMGWMRQSLLRGLRAHAPGTAEEVRVVPMIHPVHRRFSEAPVKFHHQNVQEEDDEDETIRMKKLEQRLHVFELLFQAYYIDDEVFRSLHRSMN